MNVSWQVFLDWEKIPTFQIIIRSNTPTQTLFAGKSVTDANSEESFTNIWSS